MAHDVRPYSYHGLQGTARTDRLDLSRSPVDIARDRAAVMYPTSARDQERFMDIFGQIRIASLRGRDVWWLWREALNQGDTVAVSAHIEGAASAARERLAW